MIFFFFTYFSKSWDLKRKSYFKNLKIDLHIKFCTNPNQEKLVKWHKSLKSGKNTYKQRNVKDKNEVLKLTFTKMTKWIEQVTGRLINEQECYSFMWLLASTPGKLSSNNIRGYTGTRRYRERERVVWMMEEVVCNIIDVCTVYVYFANLNRNEGEKREEGTAALTSTTTLNNVE